MEIKLFIVIYIGWYQIVRGILVKIELFVRVN
jgi:hypothetical protein